jgi:hypothetical protein
MNCCCQRKKRYMPDFCYNTKSAVIITNADSLYIKCITPQRTVRILLAFPSFNEYNGTLVVFACAHNVVDGAANGNGDEHD